ncbi:MAG: hypothetical protein M3N19_01055 [Candidatus Eremiobacteraeota bacterium]|nr:hypothetical protein [Candidatus Eremiobacteraeota bacterium]
MERPPAVDGLWTAVAHNGIKMNRKFMTWKQRNATDPVTYARLLWNVTGIKAEANASKAASWATQTLRRLDTRGRT